MAFTVLGAGMSENLAQAILHEQERCRELMKVYASIGAPGIFAGTMISIALHKTERAVMAGDTVEMLRCYEELKGFE